MKKSGLPSRRQSSAASTGKMPGSYARIEAAPARSEPPARLFDYQQADFEQLTQDVMKQALALGGTRPLPEIYEAAGAKLVFDAPTMAELVGLVERRMTELREELEGVAAG